MLVYIRNSVVARRQPKMEPENIESICFNVKEIANTSFYVCVCYRSPNLCKVSDFISACSTAADKMLKSKREIIFLGDFNIDMLQSNCNINLHSHTNPLTDFCDQFCLTNTIDEPTRATKTSKSLIDVILVNRPEHWATSGSLQLDMNDHDLIYIVRKQRLSKSRVKVIESRSMKQFNQDAFLADLATTSWDTAFIFDNIYDVCAHWSTLFNAIVEKHATVIKKRVRSNQLPWINVEIKKAMRLRNKLYKKYRRHPTEDTWEHYRLQRNLVTKLKRVAIKRC